jgi:hypothetical protein
MTELTNRPIGFHFINTVHPSDATSRSSLSRIRSHAAKDIRARARKSHLTTPSAHRSLKRLVRCRSEVLCTEAGGVQDKDESNRTQEQDAKKSTDCSSRPAFPDVSQVPWCPGVNPHWNPARPLSAREAFLLDHCMCMPVPISLATFSRNHLTNAVPRYWLCSSVS